MKPELAILEALQPSYPRGLREPVLNAELRVRGTPMSLTDQERHCKNLETQKQVTIVEGQDYTLIKITPEGISRLAE
jgi:hypothetical protein